MKTRTLLVDSAFLLRKSFDGARNVYTDSFGHIGGLYGFLTKVRQLIRQHGFNKVVLMWDGENGGLYRYLIDPAYKSERQHKKWHEKIELSDYEIRREEQKRESLLKQKKRIQAYAEELFLRQIEVDEVEADDLIASYVIDNHEEEDVTIYTNDRDFTQLLDYNITIIFDNHHVPVSKHNFFVNFQYHYKNSLTLKIICGDKSDSIAGVGGVGEKSLFALCPDLKFKYVSVKDICRLANKENKKRIEENKKPLKKWENLLNNTERLKINHKLINLEKPYLNEEAEEELSQLEMPLSAKGRGSKNLIRYMKEDGFLEPYNGTFTDYVQPFYGVISNEKKILKEYLKSVKETL